MSETVTMTLTEFLLARIAEGEDAQARNYRDLAEALQSARVLADLEAKRRIVELHGGCGPTSSTVCETCGEGDYDERGYASYPCSTIRLLASVYADHPDYRQEWAL